MKLKSFIALALAVALAAGLWLWLHHGPQPVEKPVADLVKPDLAPLPRLVPINVPRMTTVAVSPAKVQPATGLSATTGWSMARKIVDTQVSYEDRLRAIESLPGRLTDADWALLKPFLLQPDGLDRNQLGQVIKNALLDRLCAMNPLPAGLGDVLLQMYRDPQQNEVIRDYAVQHLTPYYEQMPARDRARTGPAVQDALWEAVNETSDSVGGTALLALKRLAQEYPGPDQARLAAAALNMAGDNQAGELNQITAYQVCAQLGNTNALPLVLSAAQNAGTIPTRISAIGAMGLLGGPDQIPFLNRLLQGDEDRLKPAAQHALAQINHRQTQLASQK
jgi:hypothetical protein